MPAVNHNSVRYKLLLHAANIKLTRHSPPCHIVVRFAPYRYGQTDQHLEVQ